MAPGWIYRATCSVNGKAYIGQTRRGLEYRRRLHLTTVHKPEKYPDRVTVFTKAIIKYGEENFTWDVLLECDLQDLDGEEIRLIKEHGTKVPHGYNVSSGGSGPSGAACKRTRGTDPDIAALSGVGEYWRRGVHIGYQAVWGEHRRGWQSLRMSLQEKKTAAIEWITGMEAGEAMELRPPRCAKNEGVPSGMTVTATGKYQIRMRDKRFKPFLQRVFPTVEAGLTYRAECAEIADVMDDMLSAVCSG